MELFVKEKIVQGVESDRVEHGVIWQIFCRWADENGHKTTAKMSRQRFFYELKNLFAANGIVYGLGKRGNRYMSGIQLRLDLEEAEPTIKRKKAKKIEEVEEE